MSSTPELPNVEPPQTAPASSEGAFRDFRYYLFWWVLWIGLVSFITYTAGNEFWLAKAYQTAVGVALGIACAVGFTVLQNKTNTKRSKVVSWLLAIGVFVTFKLAASMLLTAIAAHTEAKSIEAVGIAGRKSLEDMRAKAAAESPEQPVAVAVQKEAIRQSNADLSTKSGAEKADVAAGQFLGFYMVNVRTRKQYCIGLGVDISSFTDAFAAEHAQLYAKSRAINAKGPYSADKVEEILFEQLNPSFQKVVADDMSGLAKQNNVTEKDVCSGFANHGSEFAALLHVSKINPALYQAMMEAK